MLKIGQLAKRFNLSRGTLLHYDAIGLLRPSLRTDTNYRLYSASDVERLRLICTYRSAGLKLKDIQQLLAGKKSKGHKAILEVRLSELGEEISKLHGQQHLILQILQQGRFQSAATVLNKAQWVALLKAAGLDEAGMRAWHSEFEKLSGRAHQEFLQSLGISGQEIRRIRQWSVEQPTGE
jgi:DNA-binding transcriptional MerR regulator